MLDECAHDPRLQLADVRAKLLQTSFTPIERSVPQPRGLHSQQSGLVCRGSIVVENSYVCRCDHYATSVEPTAQVRKSRILCAKLSKTTSWTTRTPLLMPFTK